MKYLDFGVDKEEDEDINKVEEYSS
jgi:hypothetical protein